MKDAQTETLRDEDVPDSSALVALLELARAFAPSFGIALPRLVDTPPASPTSATPEERIRKVEERYRTLVEQIPAVTFMASFENGISEVYVSPHIETMLGYTAKEWVDDPILWYQRLHPADRVRWNKEFSRTVSWAEPFSADYRFLAKDGRVVWIHGEAKVVRDASGRPSFVQGIGYDVTRHKEAEEVLQRSREELEEIVKARTAELQKAHDELESRVAQRTEALALATAEAERANQAKSEFLSRMSHELRTPLNAILGFAQILEMEKRLGAKQRKSVGQILTGGRHLLELINEVLDLTRIESGHMTVSLEAVSVRELLAETFSLVAPLAADLDVRMSTTLADDRDWLVLADRRRLKQALLNLLTNAIKYNNAKGGVEVDCAPAQATAGPRFRLSVKDTGPGLPPEKMVRLFTPFDRLDAERTHTEIEGTGLGLAISRRLIELMNGTLGVESYLGKGSTFWIELPLADGPNQEQGASGSTEKGQEPSETRAQTALALYIEDNPANLELMRLILEKRPAIRLLDTPSGLLGVEMAQQHQPDLVLLDLNLPELDGDQVLQQLRADPRTSGIPVVVISGDANPKKIEQLLAHGARDFITKPFDVRKFLALLDDILKR